jgi:hypothetical protein
MRVAVKHAHVSPDLGDDHLGGALAHTRNSRQQLTDLGERADQLINTTVQRGNSRVEVVDVVQMQP